MASHLPRRPRLAPTARALTVLLGMLLVVPTLRAETCGPTLTPIILDGEFGDWLPVLTNPLNVSLDPDGSTLPCGESLDRDCTIAPLPLDLRAFAYTWDETHLHVYLERYFPTRDSMQYWLYLDRGDDQLFDGATAPDGDLRVRINWLSTFASYEVVTTIETFTSVGRQHPMVDFERRECGPAGDQPCADGHVVGMTGDTWASLGASPLNCSGGQCARATQLEISLPWDRLGLAPGSPLALHVAASASTVGLPDALVENLGGRDGGPGSTGHHCHRLDPAHEAVPTDIDEASELPHRVTNLGNRADTFDLFGMSRHGWQLHYLSDPDGDGDSLDGEVMAIDANGDGDFDDPDDRLDARFDSNGDGRLDTGLLAGGSGVAPGDSFHFVLEVFGSETGVEDFREWIDLHAESEASGGVRSVRDVLYVSRLVTLKSQAKSVFSGRAPTRVPYPLQVVSHDWDPDWGIRTVTSSARWETFFYTDPDCNGDRSDGVEVSEAFEIDPRDETCLVAEVEVPPDTPNGTVDVTTVHPGRSTALGAVLTTTVVPSLELSPDHTVLNGLVKYGSPSSSVLFAHRLVNNTELDDRFAVSHLSSLGFATSLFTDPDGDGNPSDGELVPSGSSTPSVPSFGGVLPVVLSVEVGDVPTGSLERTELFAVSTATGDFRTVLDETRVGNLVSFEDAGRTVQRTSFAPCDTIYVKARGLEASLVDRYQLLWLDPAARVLRRSVLSSDGLGEADDALELSLGDLDGSWTLSLRTCSVAYASSGACAGTESIVDGIELMLDNAAAVSELASDRAVYRRGDRFTARATFVNDSPVTTLADTRVDFTLLTPDSSHYCDADGVFQPFHPEAFTQALTLDLLPSERTTEELVLPEVSFPAPGADYLLRVRWNDPCGAVLLVTDLPFAVEAIPEDCTNGTDDDGDGLVDCDDVDCEASAGCRGGLAVSRRLRVVDGVLVPSLAEVLDPSCAAPGVRLCLDGPEDERVPGPVDGLILPGAALSNRNRSLWLFEHEGSDATLFVRKSGSDLVFSAG
ncbi:MAG: hypothetical protein AAF533_12820 [Acidobacteriota bacterium]